MKRSHRLLIVDSDVSYSNHLRECFNRADRITVVGVANEGTTALKMLRTEQPDVLLIDPLIPEIDGISIIREAYQSHKAIKLIICLSQFHSVITVEAAQRSGASYYLYKPIDTNALISTLVCYADVAEEMSHLEVIHQEINDNTELHRVIREILHELGFSPKLSGSHYIEESIAIAYKSPMLLRNVYSGLYRFIAECTHTTSANIERCNRTAIAAADADGRLTKRINSTPTNKACIRYILSLLTARI